MWPITAQILNGWRQEHMMVTCGFMQLIPWNWLVQFGTSPLDVYYVYLNDSLWYTGTSTTKVLNGEWNTTYKLQVVVFTKDSGSQMGQEIYVTPSEF